MDTYQCLQVDLSVLYVGFSLFACDEFHVALFESIFCDPAVLVINKKNKRKKSFNMDLDNLGYMGSSVGIKS